MRLLYASGPGDTIGTFRLWLRGQDDPSVPDVAYSRQFFDICKEARAEAWVISSHSRVESVEERGIRVEHRPVPWIKSSGMTWHAGHVRYTRGLLRSALEFKADVVVISGHGTHWFPLKKFARHGIKVVACLHNTLWPVFQQPDLLGRLLLRLARPFFAEDCLAVLSHPGACVEQLSALTEGRSRQVIPFLPLYRPAMFEGIATRVDPASPFRVLFVGRMEREKGVYDLLEIARQFARDGRKDIEFDLCGTGSVLEALRADVAQAGLGERFRVHGHTQGAALRERFARSHAVVVPTRSTFSEGFNAVVCEAVLSGRPVITSRVCPALGSVAEAALEVPPDDVAAYRAAIERLAGDASLYAAKREACARLAAQFLDSKNSWGAGLSGILKTAAGS